MDIRSEKGISGIDVMIAIFLITIFVTLMIVMSSRLSESEKEISRSTEAAVYATNLVEEIKGEDISVFVGMSNPDTDNLVAIDVVETDELYKYSKKYVENQSGDQTAFYQEVFVIDYSDINTEDEIEAEVLKKIIVKVSYREQDQIKSITLETMVNGGIGDGI